MPIASPMSAILSNQRRLYYSIPDAPPGSEFVIHDTFTGADNDDLLSHPPDVDTVGSGWISYFFTIIGNKLRGNSTSTNPVALIDAGLVDLAVSCDITMVRGDSDAKWPALIVRSTGPSGTSIFIRPNGADGTTTWKVQSFGEGFITNFTGAAVTDGLTYNVKATCVGRIITFEVDDVLLGTVELTDGSEPPSIHEGVDATYVGLQDNTYTGVAFWDNFLVETV